MTREEAIKILRETHDNSLFSVRAALETLIPELKENEDERIGNVIYCIVRDNKEVKRILEGNGVSVDNALAYLEKQKYDRMQPIYDNQESFESALDKAWKSYNDSGARTVDGCEDNYTECAHAKGFREGYLFGLGKYKDFDKMIVVSPEVWDKAISDAYENGKKDGEKRKEQKPAEWSKNDTAFLNEITDFFENKTVRLQHDIDMYAHWLKSLPGRFNLEPKQEWNDEDERKYQCIRNILLTDMDKKVGSWKYSEILEWYEKRGIGRYTNYKSSWKPSEEQMEAFKKYIEEFQARAEAAVGGWNNFDVMIQLYKQLKKLQG